MEKKGSGMDLSTNLSGYTH